MRLFLGNLTSINSIFSVLGIYCGSRNRNPPLTISEDTNNWHTFKMTETFDPDFLVDKK